MKKYNNSRRKPSNREMKGITYFFVLLFFSMIVYFCYFMLVLAPNQISSPYNARIDYLSSKVIRGSILSSDGKVLAKTENGEGGEKRVYPEGIAFSHPIGYSSKGKTGVESMANFYLSRSSINPLQKIINQAEEIKNPGDSVVLSLNSSLQSLAYSLLKDKKGSIVCMNPKTGRILAVVSAPSFTEEDIQNNWEALTSSDNKDGNLLNRATQGLYPPGSTFKLLMALEYIREHPADWQSFSYTCKGEYVDPENSSYVVHCYNGEVHGKVDLESAIADSCNSAFAKLGTEIDPIRLKALAESFYYNQKIDIGLSANAGQFTLAENADVWDKMQTAIGQGATLCTPLQNLCMVSAIANGGNLVYPSLLSSVQNANGTTVKEFPYGESHSLLSQGESDALKQFMRKVVTEGTASALETDAYKVCGKTGSAQVKVGNELKTNAWFVGFAPMEDPEIAISVIVEEGETGGKTAAPIARKVLDQYFHKEG